MSTLPRRLAVLERGLMDAAESEQEQCWQRIEAAIGPPRYAALLASAETDPGAFNVAMQQVLDADPDLAACWQRGDLAARARFLAIRCNAPALPIDAGIVALFTTHPPIAEPDKT